MTYRSYEIEIEGGGTFDVEFTQLAQKDHKRAARLIKLLEAFAKDRDTNGEFLRGAALQSIFVVPPYSKFDGDGEAGLLALVSDETAKIMPLRLLHSSSKHQSGDYVTWAEAFLKI